MFASRPIVENVGCDPCETALIGARFHLNCVAVSLERWLLNDAVDIGHRLCRGPRRAASRPVRGSVRHNTSKLAECRSEIMRVRDVNQRFPRRFGFGDNWFCNVVDFLKWVGVMRDLADGLSVVADLREFAGWPLRCRSGRPPIDVFRHAPIVDRDLGPKQWIVVPLQSDLIGSENAHHRSPSEKVIQR